MPAPKRRTSRSRRLLVVVLLAVILASMGEVGVELWRHQTEDPIRDPLAPAITLDVPPGASTEWIARQLTVQGFVPHPLVFRAFVVSRSVGHSLRAGEYALDSSMSLAAVVDKLARGDVIRHEITFPEGKNLAEASEIAAARKVDSAGFLAAARDPSVIRDLDPKAQDLEGYLFPDTYDLPRNGNVAAILVEHMVGRFRKVIDPELAEIAARRMSVRDVVTLASLVELETARVDERPRIAAVFLNRLAKGMPLQTDPTVIYVLKKKGVWDGNIRRKDLELDSPFNTYRVQGLPPGPIASPGKEALLAVLRPAPVKDLYFVSRNDGTHQFSETLAEHNRAVDIYQKHRAGRRES